MTLQNCLFQRFGAHCLPCLPSHIFSTPFSTFVFYCQLTNAGKCPHIHTGTSYSLKRGNTGNGLRLEQILKCAQPRLSCVIVIKIKPCDVSYHPHTYKLFIIHQRSKTQKNYLKIIYKLPQRLLGIMKCSCVSTVFRLFSGVCQNLSNLTLQFPSQKFSFQNLKLKVATFSDYFIQSGFIFL